MTLILARVLLGLSGILLLLIGAAVLFQPEGFASANGITLSDSPSMRSEYRAPGGLLLVSAVIVLLGSVRRNLMRISLALAALVYSSYGISRLIAMTTDGMPSAALTQATIIELLLGLTSLIVLLRVDRSWANQRPR